MFLSLFILNKIAINDRILMKRCLFKYSIFISYQTVLSMFLTAMDFLKNLVNFDDNKLCFLCFKKNKDLESISKNLHIIDEDNNITSSIHNMMTYLFPSCEILFQEVCLACSSLILSMYLKLRRYEVKKKIYALIVENFLHNINKDVPINRESHKFHIKIPKLCDKEINSNKKMNENTDFEEKVNYKFEDLRHETKKKICVKNNSTVCHTCGKDCRKPNALKSHLNCHREKACPYCLKVLKTHSHFKIHVKSHEGIKKVRQKGENLYYCNDCEYRSLNKSSLQAHINKYHLGERPFVCEICSKGFYKKSNLTEHVLTHTNTKNLTCEQCGENFVHKKTLAEHLRLHSGEKPFQCKVCNAKFVTSGRRSDHFKRKHGNKNECCDICGKKYSLKKDLNRHIKTVHVQTDSKIQFFQTDYQFLDDNGDVLPVLSSI